MSFIKCSFFVDKMMMLIIKKRIKTHV